MKVLRQVRLKMKKAEEDVGVGEHHRGLHSWIWALYIFAFVPQKKSVMFSICRRLSDSFPDAADRCSQEYNWQPGPERPAASAAASPARLNGLLIASDRNYPVGGGGH